MASRILWYPSISSTNDVASSLGAAGAPEGTVVAADMQTAGRGRMGRTWASPPGAGLYLSVVLRPPSPILGLITLAAGVALAEGIQRATGLQSTVKWPNDVYAGSRKLAGILTEAGTGGAGIQYVVVGIGINVIAAPLPRDLDGRAGSLEGELGRAVDRGLVLTECLAALAARYDDLRDGRSAGVLGAWRHRAAATFGRRIEWDAEGATASGVLEDIDETGALVVRAGGRRRRIVSGEVRWSL
jgi:BirA family biotin operon repressor/biotin-[acetyl-CoA-carboxylase] ligase